MAIVTQYTDASEPYHDTDAEMVANAELYSVVEGCAITLDGSNMTWDLAAGYILHNGSLIAVSAQANQGTFTSDSTNPKWTFVRINGSGAGSHVDGSAASAPLKPELGDFTIVHALQIQANLTVAASATVTLDKRVLSRELFTKGSDVSSASTVSPSGNIYRDVTGTTTITSLGNAPAGWIQFFQFDGALIVTHNATSLIMAEAANYTTAAGDVLAFVCEGSSNWREIPLHTSAAGAGLVFVGSDTTESTSTSSTPASGQVISSISIAQGTPTNFVVACRAASTTQCQVRTKLNSTVTSATITATGNSDGDEALVEGRFIVGETNYDESGGLIGIRHDSNGFGAPVGMFGAAAGPTATITAIDIEIASSDNSNTAGIDTAYLYKRALS